MRCATRVCVLCWRMYIADTSHHRPGATNIQVCRRVCVFLRLRACLGVFSLGVECGSSRPWGRARACARSIRRDVGLLSPSLFSKPRTSTSLGKLSPKVEGRAVTRTENRPMKSNRMESKSIGIGAGRLSRSLNPTPLSLATTPQEASAAFVVPPGANLPSFFCSPLSDLPIPKKFLPHLLCPLELICPPFPLLSVLPVWLFYVLLSFLPSAKAPETCCCSSPGRWRSRTRAAPSAQRWRSRRTLTR